jgi:hypothetical protein
MIDIHHVVEKAKKNTGRSFEILLIICLNMHQINKLLFKKRKKNPYKDIPIAIYFVGKNSFPIPIIFSFLVYNGLDKCNTRGKF